MNRFVNLYFSYRAVWGIVKLRVHSMVNEMLRLTLLEPAIIQSILAGKQPR